jgi:hypothetical protein
VTPERVAAIRARYPSLAVVTELADEIDRLRGLVEQLTDRVVAESTDRVDAADLQRENDALRAVLAEGATSEAAVAKLREWTAGSRHAYEPGALQISMPVTMACKIIDEIDRLTMELTGWTESESADAAAGSYAQRAETAEARVAELEELGIDAYAEKLWQQVRVRNLEIRGGKFALDMTQTEELASAYFAFARTIIGDAANYSESKVEFDVKIAERPETYTLTVQRIGAGKLTPHEARERAEAGRDEALARVAELEADLGQRLRTAPNSDGETFEVGKYYIAANGAFVFECREIVDGIALGRELRVDERPCFAAHFVYMRERLEGCHREISADDVYQRFGRAGWNPTPQPDNSEADRAGR